MWFSKAAAPVPAPFQSCCHQGRAAFEPPRLVTSSPALSLSLLTSTPSDLARAPRCCLKQCCPAICPQFAQTEELPRPGRSTLTHKPLTASCTMWILFARAVSLSFVCHFSLICPPFVCHYEWHWRRIRGDLKQRDRAKKEKNCASGLNKMPANGQHNG